MSALTLFEHPAPPAPQLRDGGLLATRLAGKHAALITGHFVLPGREGRYAELPESLPPALAKALQTRGVTQLYAHQREAYEHAMLVLDMHWPAKPEELAPTEPGGPEA